MDYLNNKTRWIVRFNDQNNHKILNKRVLVEYFPIDSKILFRGQVKIGDYQIDFSKEEIILGDNIIGIDENSKNITKNITIEDINFDVIVLNVYLELEKNVLINQKITDTMLEYKEIRVGDSEDIIS